MSCAACGAEVEGRAKECPRCAGSARGAALRRRRWIAGAIVATALVASVALVASRRASPEAAAAPLPAGAPAHYGRPVIADANGDGVEDMIFVAAVERGPSSSDQAGPRDASRVELFVQTIDGATGAVLHSISAGRASSSGDDEAGRVVLVTSVGRLGVARIAAGGHAEMTIHELRSGATVATLSFEHATGRACEDDGPSRGGAFVFEAKGGAPGTSIDLERGASSPAKMACGDVAQASVADAPVAPGADPADWPARFSHEMKLRKGTGPYGGRLVVQSGILGVFVQGRVARGAALHEDADAAATSGDVDAAATSSPADAAPAAGDAPAVVAFDLAEGKTRFERSLASLGLAAEAVDHLEGTTRGPLLFLRGAGGLALLDAERGDQVWALRLPRGERLSRYTLTRTRAYLHVVDADPSAPPAKRGARVLVVDLERGAYVRSVPSGSLAL